MSVFPVDIRVYGSRALKIVFSVVDGRFSVMTWIEGMMKTT